MPSQRSSSLTSEVSARAKLHLEPLEQRMLLSACSVFDNPTYVDTGGTLSDESDELQAALANLGHTVSTFTGIDAAAFDAATYGNRILVIPELENVSLGAALDAAAKSEISSMVNAGGSLLIAGNIPGNAGAFLNAVFGFTLTEGSASSVASALDATAAENTAFEGGPASLADNNQVSALDTTTLPTGGLAIYEAGANEATVALIPYGHGQIVYLGYDWYDAFPAPGAQDGGWHDVLARAVDELSLDADLYTTLFVGPANTIGTDNGVIFEGEVMNVGPAPARNVTMTLELFGFGNFPQIQIQSGAFSVSASGGVITQFSVSTGTVGPASHSVIGTLATDVIDPGGVARFVFRLQTVQSGSLHAVATATTDSPDVALANNTAGFDLIVLPNIYRDGAGNLVIRDVRDVGRNDNLTLALDGGGQLVISDPGNTLTVAGEIGFGGLGQSVGSLPANSVTVSLSDITRIIIETGLGDDSVTIDNTNGLLPDIFFDGGDGADTLTLTGPADSVAHDFGPGADQGSIVQVDGADTQTILYTGLEPIVDLVAAATLTVNGTNADNAINYSQGSVATRGLVSVDGFETIEFANKTNLVINGLAGSDTINLNNPSTPTGLTTITVNGGDPTAGSDTVVVNGTTAPDAIVVDQLTADGARITGAQPVPVTVTGTEHLTINGQGGADALTYTSPTGGAEIAFTPGATPDAGTITARTIVGQTLLPVDFARLDNAGTLTFANSGGLRSDGLDIIGTDNDDQFNLGGTGSMQIYTPYFTAPVTVPISTPGVAFLRLIGGDGDDLFNVAGDHPISIGVQVQGGDPSGSDVLNFTGTGVAVSIHLGLQSMGQAGSGAVSFTGIEVLNADAAGGDLTVLGTAGPDALTVRPTGANDAAVLGGGPIVNATDIGTFTVNTLGGNDTVIVEGDELANTIAASASSVAITGRETVNLLGEEALEVRGGSGNDSFNVTPDAIPIKVFGGPPDGQIQQPAGDVLNLVGATDPVYHQGPELDAGWFTFTGAEPVSFDEIERLELDGQLLVLPDPLEPNDTIATATVLGSLPKITFRDLTIHNATDNDFFQITAQDTGKLVINLHFIHADGDLDLQVQDRLGNLIAISQSITDDELIVIPVVGQQRYFIRVYSADAIPNRYDLEIENFPAPVPTLVDLVPASDTGASDSDNLTSDSTPTVLVRADLRDFANEGIPIDLAPGADVEVTFTSAATGVVTTVNAALVSGANPTLWTATAPALADGLYYVEATVVITDGQATPAVGRWLFSQPLVLTLDTVAPTGSAPDLLAASDTGVSSTDDVTYIATPAFQGTGEPNSKVFLYANGELVGQGLVGTNGAWEVTIEPLDHSFPVAVYDVNAVYEDLAGNRSGLSPTLTIWHDSTPPNVPYLDLISEDDKGFSNTDNYTQELTLRFDVTVNDTANNGNPFPNEVQWFIQDRYENNPGEVTVASSGGFSTAGFWDDVSVTFTDYGVHNLKLVAWDRAGHRSEYLLTVTIEPDACDTSVLKLANGQVILFDSDAVIKEGAGGFEILTDVDASDFKIRVDKYNNVTRVDLVGDPTGLGILINPANGGPVEFRDARVPPPNRWTVETLDFLFINSSSPRVFIRSGIEGVDLSDILKCFPLVPDPDLDGDGLTDDPTAFYSAGPVKSFTIKDAYGDVSGDIVIKGADPFGFAVQKFDLRRVSIGSGPLVDVVLPDGAINKFSHSGGDFAASMQVQNIIKGTFGGTLTGNLTFLGDFTGVVTTGGSTFGGDVTVLGDFLGTLGGKKTPNGPSTLYLTSGQTFNGLVSRVPDGLVPVFGEDLFFGGAFAAIDVV